MLNELVKKVELKAAGLYDPFEHHRKRPLTDHIDAFEHSLAHKGNSTKHVGGTSKRVRTIAKGCKWAFINDMSPSGVQKFLADLRTGKEALSIQTSNHYLRAIKQFSRWLVRDRRTNDDPLAHLSMLNAETDRRWERRVLSADEFARLVEAAEVGPQIESIPGADRVVMYLLACWTGYRKTEIGSLTRRSLRLDDIPPTATVAAGYSKRRREDTQVLHPEIARRVQVWLAAKPGIGHEDLLFPVSDKVPGGVDRKTAKMMRLDLAAARKKWVEEAETEVEMQARERSDFLCYCDENGQYADFHSNRHTFITNLSRAGVSPKTAQTLARHSDIRLTMGVYTHIGLSDRVTAIELLPPPPAKQTDQRRETAMLRATGTDDAKPVAKKVPTVVPSGAENGAVEPASERLRIAPTCTENETRREVDAGKWVVTTTDNARTLRTDPGRFASRCTPICRRRNQVRPDRLERSTCGLEVRCSIQLSYGRSPWKTSQFDAVRAAAS